ncbi:LysM peptidoglycan-binding domain-containing protein [Bacillus sp. 1P06AnD]|uniref:cell division suppressor protein YneA n=1 Tax=Bacillus sp. 1P06AnD TaxID=3132208 RepID=UPI0039A04927
MNYFIRKHSFSLLFFVVILLFSVVYFVMLNVKGNQSYIEIEVSSGDTLWGIAERYNDQQMEIPDFIAYIEQTNKMNGEVLKAGDVIKVPVMKKQKENLTQLTME